MPDDEKNAEASEGRRIQWRCWPMGEEWPRSGGKAVFVAALCVGAGYAFEGVGYGVLAAVILMGALAKYFLPTWYVLDENGLTARQVGPGKRMAWSQVRRVAVMKDGVFVSPSARPSRMDSFRGVFLPFAGNAREVTEFVREKTKPLA